MTETTAEPPFPRASTFARLMRTPAAKIGMILCLLLLMQIPLAMVSGLIQEREARQGEALASFRQGWGPEQTIDGPLLMVPYTWRDPAAAHLDASQRDHGWARLAPTRLQVDAKLQPETRRRGLFRATVYSATVGLSGSLIIPALTIRGAPDAAFDWTGARIVLGASDLRGLAADVAMEVNGGKAVLQPGDMELCGLAGIDAPAGFDHAPSPGDTIPFSTTLNLRGTQAFWLMPDARQTDMHVVSPWTTPSFVGATLPTRYDIGANGLNAQWEIAGGPTNSGWQPLPDCKPGPARVGPQTERRSGIELQDAVPTYVMVDRAAKYGVLFLALTFLTLFLFEALSRVRIHLVQYGLVGLSVSLFALLLISIAEPLGFTASYAISTAAVVGQASLYTLSVVRRGRLALMFATVLSALFGFLYIVLSLDAYALLAGTLAVFVVLSIIMLATRHVNWAAAAATP